MLVSPLQQQTHCVAPYSTKEHAVHPQPRNLLWASVGILLMYLDTEEYSNTDKHHHHHHRPLELPHLLAMSQGSICFPYKLWEESILVKGHKEYSPSPHLLQRDSFLLPLPPLSTLSGMGQLPQPWTTTMSPLPAELFHPALIVSCAGKTVKHQGGIITSPSTAIVINTLLKEALVRSGRGGMEGKINRQNLNLSKKLAKKCCSQTQKSQPGQERVCPTGEAKGFSQGCTSCCVISSLLLLTFNLRISSWANQIYFSFIEKKKVSYLANSSDLHVKPAPSLHDIRQAVQSKKPERVPISLLHRSPSTPSYSSPHFTAF